MIEISKTREFESWYLSLTFKDQLKVNSRLDRIREYEHFGDVKSIGKGLVELRWANGWRVYFVTKKATIILLLNGGNKNAQKKDIEKARILIKRYTGN